MRRTGIASGYGIQMPPRRTRFGPGITCVAVVATRPRFFVCTYAGPNIATWPRALTHAQNVPPPRLCTPESYDGGALSCVQHAMELGKHASL